jgi:hypothetical protein
MSHDSIRRAHEGTFACMIVEQPLDAGVRP